MGRYNAIQALGQMWAVPVLFQKRGHRRSIEGAQTPWLPRSRDAAAL